MNPRDRDPDPPATFVPDRTEAPVYPTAQFDHVVSAVRELKHLTQIGPYHILSLIGEGGMGQVYKAEQRQPIHRVVAIKIIKLGMDTAQVIARFESERQALALMNHVNVARVLDAGATETGRPYFVMEYVAGEPITTFADRQKLTLHQRLELFMQACDAVQHAHQKAIIHRDLKPSNILVTLQDGTPLVKVIDFGVAKAVSQRLTERTLFTETGQLVGTPEYMSPEQAEMSGLDVDTRTDVYSLGVVLYELLSGSLPFDPQTLRCAGYNEIQRIIRDVDPPRPSARISSLGAGAQEVARLRKTPLESLQRQLKHELEWIPLKAMQKDRSRRYASAIELSEDVENYLSNRPLRAAPDSAAYRIRKFIRRNKRGVAAAAAMMLLLLGGVGTTTWQAVRATRERNIAVAARAAEAEAREYESQTDQFLIKMFTSIDPAQARGRNVLVKEILDQAAGRIDAEPPKHKVVEASLRAIFGRAYQSLGLYELSRRQLQRSVELYRGEGPPRQSLLMRELGALGETLLQLGKPTDAELAQREALNLYLTMLGADHAETIAAQAQLAHMLTQSDKLDAADALLADAIQRVQRNVGIDPFTRATVADGLATLRTRQGRYADAESVYRDTLADLNVSGGRDHPQTISILNNLAMVLNEQSRYVEAAGLLRDSLELARKVYGPDHPGTLVMANNLALAYQSIGQLEEAQTLYVDTIARRQRALGEDDPGTLLLRSNYGLLLQIMGRLDESEATFRDVIARMKRAMPLNDQDTLLAVG